MFNFKKLFLPKETIENPHRVNVIEIPANLGKTSALVVKRFGEKLIAQVLPGLAESVSSCEEALDDSSLYVCGARAKEKSGQQAAAEARNVKFATMRQQRGAPGRVPPRSQTYPQYGEEGGGALSPGGMAGAIQRYGNQPVDMTFDPRFTSSQRSLGGSCYSADNSSIHSGGDQFRSSLVDVPADYERTFAAPLAAAVGRTTFSRPAASSGYRPGGGGGNVTTTTSCVNRAFNMTPSQVQFQMRQEDQDGYYVELQSDVESNVDLSNAMIAQSAVSINEILDDGEDYEEDDGGSDDLGPDNQTYNPCPAGGNQTYDDYAPYPAGNQTFNAPPPMGQTFRGGAPPMGQTFGGGAPPMGQTFGAAPPMSRTQTYPPCPAAGQGTYDAGSEGYSDNEPSALPYDVYYSQASDDFQLQMPVHGPKERQYNRFQYGDIVSSTPRAALDADDSRANINCTNQYCESLDDSNVDFGPMGANQPLIDYRYNVIKPMPPPTPPRAPIPSGLNKSFAYGPRGPSQGPPPRSNRSIAGPREARKQQKKDCCCADEDSEEQVLSYVSSIRHSEYFNV